MSKEVGARVQQIRADVKLNQRDFAARLGISSGGISQVESGKAMPGGDFLLKIHQEFGVDVTWLLTGVSATGSVPSTQPLTPRQAALLDNYEHTNEQGKKIIEAAAFAAAQPIEKQSKAR